MFEEMNEAEKLDREKEIKRLKRKVLKVGRPTDAATGTNVLHNDFQKCYSVDVATAMDFKDTQEFKKCSSIDAATAIDRTDKHIFYIASSSDASTTTAKKFQKSKMSDSENSKTENGSKGDQEAVHVVTFPEMFKAFSKFGDSKSDGKHISLSQSDKWFKQAKVIDGKKITTTDTAIQFKKLKSQKAGIVEYRKFLEDLAKTKGVELDEIKTKLINCGVPHHAVQQKILKYPIKKSAHMPVHVAGSHKENKKVVLNIRLYDNNLKR